MINLIPMAGLGNRFAAAGYTTPKALIPISGKPMILRVTEMMPKADKWVFVLRKEHVDKYQVDEAIKKEVPNSEFIIIDYNTEGQLSTCLLAEKYINNDEELFIGACDHGFLWSEKKFNSLRKKYDVVPWVFTKQKTLSDNPTAWGWVKTDKADNVLGVSVKTPISDTPFDDYAITAAFYYRTGKIFLDIANKVIADDTRIKGEFYADTTIDYAPKMNYKTKAFVVDKYLSWGTPRDYEEFLFWQEVFGKVKFM